MTILIVTQKDGDAKLEVEIDGNLRLMATAPRAFINDQIGDGANADAVTSWFLERSDDVEAAVKAKHEGGQVKAPFDRLILEGMA